MTIPSEQPGDWKNQMTNIALPEARAGIIRNQETGKIRRQTLLCLKQELVTLEMGFLFPLCSVFADYKC